MKILVLGHAGHGKDTFAEMLRDEAGFKFESSSYAVLEKLWPVLRSIYGYAGKSHAYNDRVTKRHVWRDLISLFCCNDKTALSKLILDKCDVYVGMRANDEYQASKHLFDLILWVDASERVPSFDTTLDIMFSIEEMVIVDNNGTIEQLREEVKLMRDMGAFDKGTTV